jgi:AcrR family transcriptional regulator
MNLARRKSGPGKIAPVGRRRDPALDGHILEAAIAALAEVGFDSMTMDQVAARAGSAKTSVYRRWPSKEELVVDALIWMSRQSVNVETVPDTGDLRGDLLAVQKDHSAESSSRKTRVLAGLGSFLTSNSKVRDEVSSGIFGPLLAINRKIMKRARRRGDVSLDADIELACQTIVATITYKTTILHKPFDKAQYAKLLDAIILPALKLGLKK